MPFKVDWYIEHQVISVQIWGDQTLDEMETFNQTMIDYLDKVPADRHFIHTIINDERLESAPGNIAQVLKVVTYSKHPNLGWTVMYGDKKSNVADFVAIMLAKITRARFIRMKTLDEVIQHLQKVDQTLDWDQARSEALETPTEL